MPILIAKVFCTDERFLDFYKKDQNLALHSELYPVDGLPIGFIAIEQERNEVIGAGMIIDELMHNLLTHTHDYNDGNPWLMALAVKKNYQNKGVGKELVDAAIQYCHDLNYTQLNLNTESATNFYKKHWIIDLISTDLITTDQNENKLSDVIKIDIKKNIHYFNKKTVKQNLFK